MIWGAWIVGTILAYIIAVRLLKKIQFGQLIYEDSPSSHQAKQGTPTMGGIVLFLSFITGLLLADQWNLTVLWIVLTTGLFWGIGFVDDLISILKKDNQGLTAKTKFSAQILVSVLAIALLWAFVMPIPVWQAIIFVFLLTGASNATNLTDGVDGLLSSTMLVSLLGVFLVFQSLWMYEEQTLVLVMMGAIAVFLLFNWYPAKLFMGDVGSLMLGAFLAASVIATGQWPLLLGFGGIYVIETLSVIWQVAWYKRHQKRIFLMSPLHHHFELLGVNEVGVVILFVLIQSLLTWVQLL
ncbi:MAG: phospho-N-acetylmuramoyl-pentapeptide-transferase [Candidatus Margulisiibacteriota bacterium]